MLLKKVNSTKINCFDDFITTYGIGNQFSLLTIIHFIHSCYLRSIDINYEIYFLLLIKKYLRFNYFACHILLSNF